MNRAERRRLAKQHKKAPGGGSGADINLVLQQALGDHQQGRIAEAVENYLQVIRAAPDHIDALLNLGIAYEQLREFDNAAVNYRKVIALRADFPEAHYNLGNALLAAGKLTEAIPCYEAAISLKPGFMGAHFNLANVYKDLDLTTEAAAGFRKTIDIEPSFIDAYMNLGVVLSEDGQLDAAREAFQDAISLQPELGVSHRQLASITKHREYNDDIKAMENLYAKPGMRDEDRYQVAYGLAKANEDLGEYAKAFEYLAEGSRLKRDSFYYSSEEQKAYFDRFRDTFPRSLFDRFNGTGDPDTTPVFVLGMPRSGTTLVEQILASHPDVFGAGELSVLSQVVRVTFGTVAQDEYSDNIHSSDPQRFAKMGRTYIDALRCHSKDARFITDKMPQNFLHIGLIKLALPNAKIIHCKRMPEDNCLSIFKTYFPGSLHEYSYDLEELGQYYRLYEELMTHWHDVLPGAIHDIQYEDLINDQEGQSRALIAHSGLDWDDACLEFHKTRRPVKTASVTQVRSPIYKSSVELWRRYEKELAPLFEVLHSRS